MTPFKACHHCTKRFVGCHSTCKEYKEDKERHNALMKKANEDMDARLYDFDASAKRKDKRALARKKHVVMRRNYR